MVTLYLEHAELLDYDHQSLLFNFPRYFEVILKSPSASRTSWGPCSIKGAAYSFLLATYLSKQTLSLMWWHFSFLKIL